MSVLVQTIDSEDYVILPHAPDWTVKPKRDLIWLDAVKKAATGQETRLSLRDEAVHALAWEIQAFDFLEQKLLEQRVVAATKSGLAIAPYWGRGIQLAADTDGDTVAIEPTRWPFYDGQLLFFQTPGRENFDAWEFGEVLAVDNTDPAAPVIALSELLSTTYLLGTFCWPVIWGKFEGEDIRSLHLGRGTLQVRITQRTPFPTDAIVSCVGIYDFFDYTEGEISDPSIMVGGCGFAAAPNIAANTIASVAREFWDGYDVAETGPFDKGVGWSLAADVAENTIASVALDDLESYTVGAVTGADITGGTGWTDPSDITTNT